MTAGRPKRIIADPRAADMAALFVSGKTHIEIGAQYGICAERVRQLLKRWHGLTKSDGGRVVTAVAKHAAVRDAKAMARWGCTHAQYIELRNRKHPIRCFKNQKSGAAGRGIEWHFNLWEWWTVWQDSGHWEHRGRGQGYVMCRFGDLGPYEIGNVFIAPAIENNSDRSAKLSGLPIGVGAAGRKGFCAKRMIDGRMRFLGYHRTPALAHAAYLSLGPIGCEAA